MTPEVNRIRLHMLAAAVRVLSRDPSAKEAAVRAADDIGTEQANGDFDLQYELSLYIKDKLLDHAESFLAGNFPNEDAQHIKRLLISLEANTSVESEHLERGQHRMRQAAENVFREKGTHGTRRLAISKARDAAVAYVQQYANNNQMLLHTLKEMLPNVVNQVRNRFNAS